MPTPKPFVCASFASLALVAVCAAACSSTPTDDVANGSAAILVLPRSTFPTDPSWVAGLSKDSPQLGTDDDGSALFACRAFMGSVLTPGKTKAAWSVCDVSYGGHEYTLSPYQTLVPVWTAASGAAIPAGGFPTGSESGAPVYACRTVNPASSSLQAGKIKAGFTGCDYPYGGVEMQGASYGVLTGGSVPLTTTLRDAQGPIPFGAIPSGADTDGSTFYSCVAPYAGAMAVGKTKAAWNGCDISWGGVEVMVSGAHWVVVAETVGGPLDSGSRPLVAGTDTNGTPLGVCTVEYGKGFQVGKYVSWGACSFGYGGGEIALASGFSVVATPSHPPIWSEISGGQPATTSQGLSCGFSATLPLLPSTMPAGCTAGVLNVEPVWACPTSVDAQIPSRIGYGNMANLPKCNVVDGGVSSPSPTEHCEVVYTVPVAPSSESCFHGGAANQWELVWDHEFITSVEEPQPGDAGGPLLTSCQVMGCGGACPAPTLLPH